MDDMLGNELSEGDYLIDGRGRIYQVLPTPPTIAKSQVALCYGIVPRINEPTMVRLVGVQLFDKELYDQLLDLKTRIVLYEQRAIEKAPGRKEELRQRRKFMDQKLREKGLRDYEE